MTPEMQSLILPICSLVSAVIVVLVSSATNLWSKKIDVQQRSADHNQELRKIYVARKLEAGEAVIGRWTLILNKLNWLYQLYSMHNFDTEPNEAQFQEAANEEARIDSSIEASKYTDKNYYYFYFELEIPEPDIIGLMQRHDFVRGQLMDVLSERNEIKQMLMGGNPGGVTQGLEHSLKLKREEFDVILQQYLQANADARNLILAGCTGLKQQMARYDLTA